MASPLSSSGPGYRIFSTLQAQGILNTDGQMPDPTDLPPIGQCNAEEIKEHLRRRIRSMAIIHANMAKDATDLRPFIKMLAGGHDKFSEPLSDTEQSWVNGFRQLSPAQIDAVDEATHNKAHILFLKIKKPCII